MNNITNGKYLIKCFLIMLLCFVVDSTISYFLPYNYTKTSIVVIPYIALMMFCMIVKTIDVPERYFFAATCGVYYSVVYTNSLPIYILMFSFIAFARTYIYKFEKLSFFEMLMFVIVTIFIQELIVYWLMKVTGITIMKIYMLFMMRVLPTLLLNICLYCIVYVTFNYFVIGER